MEPATLPVLKAGCARPPLAWGWAQLQRRIGCAQEDAALQTCWDEALRFLEAELLDRWDIMDPRQRGRYEGRAGPPRTKWTRVQWQPAQRRLRPSDQLLAWTSITIWSKHMMRARAQLVKLLMLCVRDPGQRLPGAAKNVADLLSVFARIHGARHVWEQVPAEVQQLFALGLEVLITPSFDQRIGALVSRQDLQAEHDAAFAQRWRGWVDDAFKNGAGGAHRATKIQERLEVLGQTSQADPYLLADKAMDQWEDLWCARGAPRLPLPGDAQSWGPLPPLDGPQLRTATQTFSWKTAVGQGKLHPRALWFTSDTGFLCSARPCCPGHPNASST